MPNRYVVVVNVPGYLPEAEPVECESWTQALAQLATDLELTFETDAGDATEADLDLALIKIERLMFEAPRLLAFELGKYVHTLDRL